MVFFSSCILFLSSPVSCPQSPLHSSDHAELATRTAVADYAAAVSRADRDPFHTNRSGDPSFPSMSAGAAAPAAWAGGAHDAPDHRVAEVYRRTGVSAARTSGAATAAMDHSAAVPMEQDGADLASRKRARLQGRTGAPGQSESA